MKTTPIDPNSQMYEHASAEVGKRYGSLVVTGLAHCENHQAYLYCDCDCGTKNHVVRAASLRHGTTTSCGCARGKTITSTARENAKKYIGQKFGHLTITEILSADESKDRAAGVFCRVDCDCGKKGHVTRLTHVTRGRAKTCGHCGENRHKEKPQCTTLEEKAEALVGQRCGRLVVTGVAGYLSRKGSSRQYLYVLCDCDCGTKDHLIPAHSIREGATKSCGCLRTESYEKRRQARKEKAKAALRSAIKSAKDSKKTVKSIYTTDPLTNNGYDLSAKRLFDYWEGLDKETVCLAWQSPEKFADWGIKNGFVNGRQLARRDLNKLHNPINSYWK